MVLTHPYIIYGYVKKDGVVQAAENVLVRNETKSEEYTVVTDGGGYYNVTITSTDWYASSCDNNDEIRVTALSKMATVTVNDTTYPWGIQVDINVGGGVKRRLLVRVGS